MKKPVIQKSRALRDSRHDERGVTMILVAVAMVAIIAMAALSIDVITLYLAREEAQRSADGAALAAAKVIALSGLTGDPANAQGNWGHICGPDDGVNGYATRLAKAVAGQDSIGGEVATTTNITYSAGSGGSIGTGTADCTTLASTAFGVNPLVTVQLTRASLPTFFSRIWGNNTGQVSATATAEAYNSSNSGNVGNQTTGTMIPVQPRCVKPWVVPNQDPRSVSGCSGNSCNKFVNLATGAIQNKGMSTGGLGSTGAVGETFWLEPDCRNVNRANCTLRKNGTQQPIANYPNGAYNPTPNLLYAPGQVGTPVLAVPSCTSGAQYEEAIEGCDQPANYSCGVPNNGNVVDLTNNPVAGTTNGVSCLIRQSDTTNISSSSGQDYLNPFGAPSSYPFQMFAGSANPFAPSNSQISNSSSIVSLPIYDNTTGSGQTIASNAQTNVTFVGFLQVFINAVDNNGNINVTVLNVVGCSNGSGDPVGTSQISNTPVPVRLITPP
jgi:hypothetical protein